MLDKKEKFIKSLSQEKQIILIIDLMKLIVMQNFDYILKKFVFHDENNDETKITTENVDNLYLITSGFVEFRFSVFAFSFIPLTCKNIIRRVREHIVHYYQGFFFMVKRLLGKANTFNLG